MIRQYFTLMYIFCDLYQKKYTLIFFSDIMYLLKWGEFGIMMAKYLKRKKIAIYSAFAFIAFAVLLNKCNAYQTSTINDNFPDSYKGYINALKSSHPNWDIKAFHTHLDWNSVINSESSGTYSRISNSAYGDAWKRLEAQNTSSYNASGYVLASKSAVAYIMDPRNFLNDSTIFQFRVVDKNVDSDTEASVNGIMHSTPMANTSYASIIKNAGYSKTISPNFIVGRIRQETGCDIINNSSINGKNSKYPGYYNFFNIGAFDSSSNSVQSGINLAYSKGWNTPQKAIEGGMDFFKQKYLTYGQNTVYFQKFDVANPYGNATTMLSYQYMTNIAAPMSEAKLVYNGIVRAGTLNNKYTFYIPIYDNMPAKAVPVPSIGYYVDDNTKVYLDDPNTNDSMDTFKIRSTADSTDSSNVVYTLTQSSSINNKVIMTRTKKGVDTGWDYVEFEVNGKKVQGYIWNSYVFEYTYTKVESVSLSSASKIIKKGDTYKLTATVKPDNANFKDVTWASSNNNIATVDANGNVKAVTAGSAIISAKTNDQGKLAECTITVTEKDPVINLDKENYSVIKDGTMTFNVSIENTDISQYDVSIADESIAKIENGKIKGVSAGTTKLTVTISGTSIKKEAVVKVIELNQGDIVIDESLNVDSNVISKINPETKVQMIKEKIQTAYNVVIRNSAGVEINGDSTVGTGSKVQILNPTGEVIYEYTVVIYGDATGDGKITSKDYMMIKNHIMETSNLTGEFAKAADVYEDNKITSKDYMAIKNHIMETSYIVQR